jgi:putative ABC transport system substrate-binding protein
MKTKKIFAVLCALAICAAMFSSCSQQGGAKDTIGICQLAPHPALDAATQGFIDTLKAEFGDDIQFLNENAQGEAAVCTTIVSTFVSKKVDLILANATAALQAAAGGTKTIPVLGTSITEYGTALGIDNFNGTVGGNVSGTSDLAPLDQQAQMIVDLFPNTQKVAMLYCSSEANSDYQVKVVKAELEKKNITVVDFSFSDSNDVASVAKAAAAAADVIYIPTDNTAANCTETIGGAIGNTPAVVGEEGICKGCGVAALSISYYDLGVATGKMAIKILKGETNISSMPIEYAATFTKVYNADQCAKAGLDSATMEANGYKAIEK